jgi:hypothetical protein
VRTLLVALLVITGCQAPAVSASPSPTRTPIPFWTAAEPIIRPASAFGTLPVERQAKRILTIGTYQLDTGLPAAPTLLNVYVAGGYPESDLDRASIFGEPGWYFVPFYSLLSYTGVDQPLGPVLPAATDAAARSRAESVLGPRGLLLADTELTRATRQRAGWRLTFARRIDGRIDFANKGGTIVTLDDAGQVRDILARRRPLLEQSAYPTRTAAEAWGLVQAGRWITFYLEDGAPTTPATVDRFDVRSVDIVYVEAEVLSARDIIRPYYLFRDGNDQTIYVSAIANDQP